jgi:hypothetical protein
LAEVPKPTDIPDPNPTTVPAHQLLGNVPADLTAYADVLVELRSVIDYLSEYTSDAVRRTLGRAHDNLEEAANTLRALTTGSHVEYGVAWDVHLDGYTDISRPLRSREEAENILDNVEYTGRVVARVVLTTEWVNA